jgi:hypothetical protein
LRGIQRRVFHGLSGHRSGSIEAGEVPGWGRGELNPEAKDLSGETQ